MMTPESHRICVIGAGPSGITCGKNLRQAGLHNFVIYERSQRVGGNWVFSPDPGHSSVYQSTRSISSKSHSQFLDYPYPDHYPPYPSHSQLLSYFEGYALRFGVLPHVKFGTEVVRVARTGEWNWNVSLSNGSTESFTCVIVCNGHHWCPRIPAYAAGAGDCVIHSHDYRSPESVPGHRVLVVGAGNSACDIAVELAKHGRDVTVSMRRGYRFIPRFLLGVPSDVIYGIFAVFPQRLVRGAAAVMLDVLARRGGRSTLLPPTHALFATHPVISSEFPVFVRAGRIGIAPDVSRIDGASVVFEDGATRAFDAVVLCTGYEARFPFLPPDTVGPRPMYMKMFPPEHTDLLFLGLVQPNGCLWTTADLQAKLAANYLVGRYTLPPDHAAIAETQARADRGRYVDSPRHELEVEYHSFRRTLLREIPRSAPKWVDG